MSDTKDNNNNDTDDNNVRLGSLNVSDQAREIQGKVEASTEPFKDSPIVYFCRDCKKLVTPAVRRKKNYCPECKASSISMGTERSISNYYKITE